MPRQPSKRHLSLVAQAVASPLQNPQAGLEAASEALADDRSTAGLRCDTLMASAGALLQQEHVEEAIEVLHRALEAARASGDTTREARCLGNLGVASLSVVDLPTALGAFAEAMALAGPTSPVYPAACVNLAVVAGDLGEHVLSERYARLALALAAPGMGRAMALRNLAVAIAHQSRVDEALALLNDAEGELGVRRSLSYRLNVQSCKAWLRARQGFTLEAIGRLKALRREAHAAGLSLQSFYTSRRLVEALHLGGQFAEALELGELTLYEGARRTEWALHAEQFLWKARALHALGRSSESIACYEAYSAALSRRNHDPQRHAMCQRLYLTLEQATRAASAHRPQSAAPSYRVSPGVARSLGITAEEGRVLLVLCEGRTNPQIASAVGRSVHTVRNTLARAMRKLAADSRASLVVRALELGLLLPEAPDRGSP